MMLKAKWICIALLILMTLSVANAADTLEKKAQKAKEAGNYQEAVDYYTQMIAQKQNIISAHFERGMLYIYLEAPEKAVEDMDYVIAKRPDFADAWNLRGLLYSTKPDLEQAIADYTKAIQLDPKFGAAYVNRATAYIDKGLDDEALADFNLAQKLWKDNPEIYYNRANIYKKRREYSQAIQDYTQAITLGVDNEEIRYRRGNCYFQVGEFGKAVTDYTKILELSPNNIDYLNNRAVALDQLGRIMEADVDRAEIRRIQAENFPPVETIEYVTHYSEDSMYLLKLPKGWAFTKQNGMYSITDQPVDGDTPPRIMGQVYYALNFALGKEFTTPQETIMWWEEFITKSGDNYEHYFFRSRKDKPYKGEYPSKYNKSEVQNVKDGPKFRHFDYAIAYGTHLFHLNIQVPENEQEYYNTIMDEIVRSVALLNPPN